MSRNFDPGELEMMDRPQPVSEEFEVDLDNLRKLNRWFGSYRLIRRFLNRWLAPGTSCRVLDLATGSADIPRYMAAWARELGVAMQIDAVDAHPATLEIARRASRDFPEIELIQADALQFQPPVTYDLVCCSLALHHFSDEQACALLGHARELSHGRVLVADLARSPLAIAGIYALTATVFTERMTKFDARLSIRRAFSFAEFDGLARRAGWRDFGHEGFLFCRQAIWLDQAVNAPARAPAE